MTHEERLAKINQEKVRKEAAKAKIAALKASNSSPNSILALLKRVEAIEKLLGI